MDRERKVTRGRAVEWSHAGRLSLPRRFGREWQLTPHRCGWPLDPGHGWSMLRNPGLSAISPRVYRKGCERHRRCSCCLVCASRALDSRWETGAYHRLGHCLQRVAGWYLERTHAIASRASRKNTAEYGRLSRLVFASALYHPGRQQKSGLAPNIPPAMDSGKDNSLLAFDEEGIVATASGDMPRAGYIQRFADRWDRIDAGVGKLVRDGFRPEQLAPLPPVWLENHVSREEEPVVDAWFAAQLSASMLHPWDTDALGMPQVVLPLFLCGRPGDPKRRTVVDYKLFNASLCTTPFHLPAPRTWYR